MAVPTISGRQPNDLALNSKGTLTEQMNDAVLLINYIISEFIGIVLMQEDIHRISLMRLEPISIVNLVIIYLVRIQLCRQLLQYRMLRLHQGIFLNNISPPRRILSPILPERRTTYQASDAD